MGKITTLTLKELQSQFTDVCYIYKKVSLSLQETNIVTVKTISKPIQQIPNVDKLHHFTYMVMQAHRTPDSKIDMKAM